MISLLTNEEKKCVNKQSLINLEAKILEKLGFEFNFPGPIQSMERYLRILGYDKNRSLNEMAYNICKFQLNDARFLIYKPSNIAACSVILAINIYEKDNEKFRSSSISNVQYHRTGYLDLNLDIWNNSNVHQLTGYTLEDLKECLIDLSEFISTNLSPNRLETFDLSSIMAVPMYKH